jgi:hypothetical protein
MLQGSLLKLVEVEGRRDKVISNGQFVRAERQAVLET